MATDGGEPPHDISEDEPLTDTESQQPPVSDQQPSVSETDPRARTHPVVGSLVAALPGSDGETAEKCGIALCLIARSQRSKVSVIIGLLVEQVATDPGSEAVCRTLATLIGDHGREIRGALMTETSYGEARRLYGLLEHTEPWELSAVEVEPDAADGAAPSFFSAVLRLVELDSQGRDPLDSDAWTRFIQRLPGEGGEGASDQEIERAAARKQSRPRGDRKRHRRIQQIAHSQTFLAIEARSRFDELEVLSPLRRHRFARTIRARGRIGAEEYALLIRLCHQHNAPAFRRRLTDALREWARLDTTGVVRVLDWGPTPRPWIATAVFEGQLSAHGRLSRTDALDHGRVLTRALVELHSAGVVHGGIDPGTVRYPPNTLDGVADPMLDNVGLLPVYRRAGDPDQYLDRRYAAPEQFDDRYGRVDHSTDIYQLGMVLYRALTGNHPFADGGEIVEQVCHQQLDVPSTVVPDLPAGIDEIVEKATSKEKLTRYETAVQFHHELRALSE